MEKEQNTIVQDDEIDLLEILMALKRRLWMIVLAVMIGGGVAGTFSKLALIPQYTSTAMVYILSKETTLTSLADLQIGSQLTKDYRVIVTSRPVLEDVIRTLKLDMTHRALRAKITIDNPQDTRILSITVQDPDPQLAKEITDTVADTASQYIGDIMEMVPPRMIESGEVSFVQSSPSNKKNAMIGALAGAFLVCGLITLEVILNDTIRNEEDVEKYLGLTVLAVVPEREGEVLEKKEVLAKNKSTGRRKKSRRREK